MSNLYRGSSIDASYQVSYHLAKRFQRKSCFRNRTIRNNESKRNEQFPQRTIHRCFLPRFSSFGKAVSEDKIFRNRPIRNKNCLWQPYLLIDQDEMSKRYRGRPINDSYQVLVHLAKSFQRRSFFRNQPIKNKNCLWRSCLLTDEDKMRNLSRKLFIDVSYQVLVHLAKWFQRRII